jgi:hypothetical protein
MNLRLNMQIRNLITVLLTLVLTACAATDSGRRDVIPRQLAEDLANGQFVLDMPDGFPAFEWPDGVTVEGSLNRGFSSQAILRSELPEEALEQALKAAFLESGWVELEQFSGRVAAGFVTNTGPNFQGFPRNQLCHDRYGILSINPRGQQGIYNRLGLDWNRNATGPGQMNCEQQNQQRQGQQGFFNPARQDLNRYMPILELPPADRGASFRFGGQGMGGSGGDLTARSPLVIDWSLRRIINWFAGQLEEQDWERDARWTGEDSAGSTWRSVTEDDIPLTGLLDITHVEEDTYQLRFRVSYKGR